MAYYRKHGITILHGDARRKLRWARRVDLVLTDPPYGIRLRGLRGKDCRIVGDEDQQVGADVLHRCDTRGWPLVVFASPKKPWHMIPGWRQHLVWDKGPAVGGGGDWKRCWKLSWEMIQTKGTGPLNGKREPAVLKFPVTPRNFEFHPNQKPIPLLEYLIEKSSPLGAVVLDPFMGSGSTLVAARNTGGRAIGIEVEKRYCKIAAERLERLTA